MAQISVSARRVVGRLRPWIYPSRRQVALIVAVEGGTTVLGLPQWVHLAVALMFHRAIYLVGRLR